MKGKDVWIRNLNAMRTADISLAHQFKSKDDADKSLCGFAQNGKVIKDNWEVSPKESGKYAPKYETKMKEMGLEESDYEDKSNFKDEGK